MVEYLFYSNWEICLLIGHHFAYNQRGQHIRKLCWLFTVLWTRNMRAYTKLHPFNCIVAVVQVERLSFMYLSRIHCSIHDIHPAFKCGLCGKKHFLDISMPYKTNLFSMDLCWVTSLSSDAWKGKEMKIHSLTVNMLKLWHYYTRCLH